MRRVVTTSTAAALALLIAPTAAHAIRPFSSDIDAGKKGIELVSDYKAPGSTKTTTTTTTVPAGSGGGGGVASAGGGDASSPGAAEKGASSSSTKPQPPSLKEVLDITNPAMGCGAGVPWVNCLTDTPAPAPESGEQGPRTRTVTTTVTREEVFERAIDQITLTPPELGASPCLADPSSCTGTVGVPVWLWVEDGGELPSETAEATAGPFTVQAEATVARVEWSLGDGQSAVCEGAGTVFDADVHGWSAPDCGFETGWKKAGTYTLTATYEWEVSWSGDVDGSMTRELSSSQEVNVREIQAVVDSHSA